MKPYHILQAEENRLQISKWERYSYLKTRQRQRERGVVIMDRSIYTDKCMSLLSSNQSIHISNDPTKSLKSNIQRTLLKIKSKLSEQEHKKLYPTGSCPGKFYGTTKIHKFPVNGGINELPIRPIVSILNTAV